MKLDELASAWWSFHNKESREGGELSDAEYELMDAADEEVERLSQSVGTLGALVEALVDHAPRAEWIPYIGTWVLEDAETYVGRDGISQVLSRLDPPTAERVASGYLPNFGLPD